MNEIFFATLVKQVAIYSSITSGNQGWGVLVCADSADAEGVGRQKLWKTC